MIASLDGTVCAVFADSLILEVGGIGLLPLSRPSVYLDEIGPVSRPAASGWRAMGGLAWHFE